MADVFSSQSGVVEFKSPEAPLLVDIKGNLSVDNTIISPDSKDLILSAGSKTVVVDTGGTSIITTPSGQSLVIKPDRSLMLNETIWPETSGTVNQMPYMINSNTLGWTSSALSLDPAPTLAGNLNVTGFEIFTASPIPANPTHNDLDMYFKSAGEINFDVNTTTPANSATMVVKTSSNKPLSIAPSADLYLRGYKWPAPTAIASQANFALTLTNIADGAGDLVFADISGMQDLFDDKTPQLGGNLDTLGFDIFSSNSTDININPGSRVFSINTGQTADIEIAPEDAQSLFVRGGPLGGNLHLNATSPGKVYIEDIEYPADGGTAGHFLQTNGTGAVQIASWTPAVVAVAGSNGVTATLVSPEPPSGREYALTIDSTVIRTTGGQTINGSLNIGDTTITGSLSISQNLTVGGTITGVQRTVSTGDNAILLNSDLTAGTAAQSGGFYVWQGPDNSNNAQGLVWNQAEGEWQVQSRTGVVPPPGGTGNIDVGTETAAFKIWHDGNTSTASVGLLDGQPGSYYLNASNLNTGTVPAAQMPSYTGDVTSASGSNINVLSSTGVTASTYGSSTNVPRITVDAKGRITNAINQAIPITNTSTLGLVRLATTAETSAGTLDTVATTPAGVKAIADGKQNSSPALTSIAGLGIDADQMIYGTGANTYATTPITAFGRNLLDEVNAAGARTTLGLLSAATYNASTTNTANTVVLRDASGNLPGLSVSNASTAGALSPGANINGVLFTGDSPITIADTTKLPLAGGTMTGILATAAAVGATTVGTQAEGSLGVRGNAGAGAVMSFHRTGAYAVNMGLDTDNVFRLGGWSDGANIYRWTSAANGNFTARGDITAFSDARLKTNIEVIPDALNKVCALRGVTYDRIDTKERQTGLIAQELYEVLPEAVHVGADEDQTLSVAYGNVIGLLVESIKELRAEIEALKADK